MVFVTVGEVHSGGLRAGAALFARRQVKVRDSSHCGLKWPCLLAMAIFRVGDGAKAHRSGRLGGGDAYAVKLPGKTPLNMYLGWYIKNAIGSEPKMDANSQPVRAQVAPNPELHIVAFERSVGGHDDANDNRNVAGNYTRTPGNAL